MQKLISGLFIILVLTPFFTACNKEKISPFAGDIMNVKAVKIKLLKDTQSQGWEWMEKEITNQSDVEKVLNTLKSFNYKDIEQTQVTGFGLIVEYKADKEYTCVFSGDRVNINGKYYGITTREDENMEKLYESLSYNENPSKP